MPRPGRRQLISIGIAAIAAGAIAYFAGERAGVVVFILLVGILVLA